MTSGNVHVSNVDADFGFTSDRKPFVDGLADDLLLDRQIHAERFAGEQADEGLAQFFMLIAPLSLVSGNKGSCKKPVFTLKAML